MDSDWYDGVFLGLRTVSGEYLIGAKEGVFRPRTVKRVPVEKRWGDNASFVTGTPWKQNSQHEVGEEVMLDVLGEAPTPSPTPVSSPLPPRTLGEPSVRNVRQFYVHKSDLDPKGGGIGFTDGCKGCRAIVYGKPRVGHDNHCRHRVIETASTNPKVAAKVKVAIDRDVRWHALKLEESETRRKEQNIDSGHSQSTASADQSTTGKREAEGLEDEGRAPDQYGGASSSGGVPEASNSESTTSSTLPKVKSKLDKKKHAVSVDAGAQNSSSSSTELMLPSFGKVLLRPRDEGAPQVPGRDKAAQSKTRKKAIPEPQKI